MGILSWWKRWRERRRKDMTPGQNAGGNPQFSQGVGEMFIRLALEFQERQAVPNQETHAQGLMRSAYGALLLELAVRVAEKRGEGAGALHDLDAIENEIRSELTDAVAAIRK
jgi:hypothetical protein